MTHPWTAQHTVTPAMAKSRIESQFPELAPARVELLGAGWDNTAYRVNAEFVFRFPRRELAVSLLETELRALPPLAGRLPLAVPDPRFSGSPTGEHPWPFAGYVWLPGRTACSARLTTEQRLAAADPLARFLRALHAVGRDGQGPPGVPGDRLGRLDLDRRRPAALALLRRAAAEGLVAHEPAVRDLLAEAPGSFVPQTTVLVHGDLYARHLLVDDAGRLTGVIDWGDVHYGDPAIDLAIVETFLPADGRKRFWEVYGPVPEQARRVARARAAWHTLWLLVYAHEVADESLLREARVSLRHLTGCAAPR